jgi:two-component system NtrC family sensor kinase
MAFGLLNQIYMHRIFRLLALTVAVLLAGITVGLGFLAFTRKVATFERAGFSYERAGGTLVVTSVEPGGAASEAGLAPGDRIVTVDGQSASSLAEPEKSLARPAFPHRLLTQRRDGDIRKVLLEKPPLMIDWKYLFLALVGLLYLSIGLFTLTRERTPAAGVFWAICLSSFAIYVLTQAGPHDVLWKAFWLTEDFYRALLPALLLHFFLVFPAPAVKRRWLPLVYLPGLAYLALQEAPFLLPGLDAARMFQGATRLWHLLFAVYGAALLVRLIVVLKHPRTDAEAEKQIRWIGLGVVVGLSPFLVFSAVPEALGVATPWLSKMSLLPLILIPLAFSHAILKWRLWDVEIFIREALATTAAVLLCGMTFVLLNALMDRTLEGMAEAGKSVVAFGSGLILASLLVPMKKRITDVLEKFQYHETFRARRALLDIARDFSTPRPQEHLAAAIVQRVDRGLHVVPCSLFRFESGQLEDYEAELLEEHLTSEDVWRLRGSAFAPGTAARLYAMGYRSFFAMRCGGRLVGALGVGHKDGRVPLSSEDEALLVAVMAQAGLAYENARLYGALAERLEEIRTLQQYQESVIRSSSSGIAVLDREDRLHLANPAFAALVGRSEQEILGLTFSELLPGVGMPPPAAGEPERALEARFVNASGEERNLRVSVSDFQGEPDRKVVLVDDVTDRVRAERALAERERLASLGILAAGVAHEVNTPIAGLSSYAQLLLADTSPGDPRYEILKKMERQTFRAAHLVNNLLEFARPRTPARARTDVRAVLESAAESVEAALGLRPLSVQVDGDGEPVCVLGDPRELEQVFVNLLSNARDASPDGSPITCAVRQEGETVRVTIADRGAGLPSVSGDKLFQPFFTTKKSGGTGLGLAISRDIARRHGGDIRLEPREGGGVRATVTLPVAKVVS